MLAEEMRGATVHRMRPCDCEHIEAGGQYLVYVRPTCPHAMMIHGRLVSRSEICAKCRLRREQAEERA